MANQEGIDIIIKATDQYTKTINNITASNELLGKSVKSVQKELDATTKLWTTLRVQGLDPASASMKVLKMNAEQLNFTLNSMKTAATGADNAITGSANNLKKSNQNWTALSLVVQDLPYGFRGIQNNLPALLGGIAGIGGAAYLAFSAVIATLTALDSGLISFGGKVKLATDYNKEFAQSLAEQKVKLDSLYGVATNVNKSMDDRISAAKKLKEEYPKLLENFSAEDIAAGKATIAYNKLSQAVIRYAKAEAAQAAIKEIVTKQIENDLKIAEKELQLKDANASADKVQEKINQKNLVYAAGTLNLERVRASTIKDNLDGLKAQNKQLGVQLSKYEDIYNVNASSELDPIVKPGGKTPEQLAKDKLKAIENANNAEIKAFTETLDERDKKEYDAGLKLAQNLQAMKAAGYTDATTYYTAYRAEIDKIDTYYNDKEVEQARKTSEKIAKDAEVLDNRQLQNSLDALKIESDVAMKIANLSGNANAADRIKILEDYKNSLYDLASVGGYTAEQYDRIDDAIRRVDGAIEGSKDKVKNYTVTWQETVNAINGILTNLDVSLLTNLGEQIGNMLAGGEFDISQMGAILADALSSIGKALIAFALTNGAAMELFKDPKTWPLALAAGIAAVAAGTALKAKISNNKTTAFANGGIVSGPTMGLVGEYPGAQNNPEVIAPLDKLKDMIGGGGGGTFVLRGQDLLLSVNRAQKASNLKGQNISLA